MKRKIVIPIVLLIILGAGAALLWSGWFNRDRENHLSISGNIELTQVDISFKVPGKLLELKVAEGDFVKKGDVIGRIDRAADRSAARSRPGHRGRRRVTVSANGHGDPMAAARRSKATSRCARPTCERRRPSWTSCWPDRGRRRSSRRKRPWRTRKRSTIRPSPIGNARKRCSRTTTFRERSSIRPHAS